MQSGSKQVKMKVNGVTKVVGTATYPIFDALSEAVETLGEPKCIELINAQARTNEMNRVRSLARGGPSSTALRNKALTLITADEWQAIAGKPDEIEKLIASKVEQLKAEAAEQFPDAADDDDDDENN